ncbi:MFS transporter [Actinomadura rubrobrunea]|uniref:MFS transporter n=1 Tax=Actinomadura rubrobrunea TaxID=115335 RepID=A0A9W6PVB1_9ACTN|nr:MFS transporter [Actinomadura rubrobrunea]GLW64500.1 MFS transporter [Actinomadura rubrobrunea]
MTTTFGSDDATAPGGAAAIDGEASAAEGKAAGAGAASAGRLLDRGHRAVTAGIVLVVTLLAFEAMAVGTVMPVTARDLDGLELYAWAFSATFIASVFALVLAGGWCDRSGPAHPLLTGLAVFVAGLAAAGFAPSMWVFVLGRAVQGLGSGLAMVPLYVVVARVYPEPLRPRAFAALSAAWVLPSLLGPAVGGTVAEHAGWRWVFLGLIPLVVPPTVMLVPALRGLRRPSGSAPPPRTARHASRVLAAVTTAAGAAALLYALDHPRWSLLPVAAAAAAGLGFGLLRLMPAGTLRMRRGLPSVVLARGLLAGAFFGTDVFIPLALTSLHGFSPTQAGVVLMGASLGWSAASQYQGRSRRPRAFFAVLGAGFVTAGVVAVTITAQLPGWWTAPAWILGGVGMGLAIGSFSVLLLELSPEDEQGVNSSALQIADTLGSSLVVGAAGAVVTGFGADRLRVGLAVAGAMVAVVAVLGVLACLRLTPSEGNG